MKKLSIYFAVGLAALLSLCSCEDFLDVNKSPDNPTSITAEQVLPTIMFYTAQAQYDHADYGVYLSQCLTTGGRAQVSGYPYKNGWEFLSVNRHPQWRRHYYDLGVNIFELTEIAKKIQSPNFALIGRTVKLYSTLLTTDAFGGIPLRESYGHIESLRDYWTADYYENKSTIQPKYEDQTEIYNWMFSQIDELLELYEDEDWINCPTNKTITPIQDRIYQGDILKWRAFTKALKARMMVRQLPNWNNTPETCQKIIDMVDEVLSDPNWQEPLYKFSADGSAEKNCPWGPSQPKVNLGWAQGRENLLTDAIPSKFFGYGLLGIYMDTQRATTPVGYALDPRAMKMMSPRGGKDNTGGSKREVLRYLENNIGMPIEMKVALYPDLYAPKGNNPYTRDDGYIALITTEELLFIKAEAQCWQHKNNEAYQTTLEAVEYNMNRYGVEKAEGNDKKRYDMYMAIRLPGPSITLKEVMQQKYVAMYLQAEQWTDFRRYNQSSKSNGISYDGQFIYDIDKCHDEKAIIMVKPPLMNDPDKMEKEIFTQKFELKRPYNLYEAYWTTPDCYGVNAKLSANAWIQRFNYDPETEDKYNREQLINLGAYKNPDWLKKRMIWAIPNSTSQDNVNWTDGTPGEGWK